MTDIVERLRTVDISYSETGEWCAEAADEIERLRAGEKFHRVAVIERDAERTVNAQLGIEIERLRAERDALRGLLDDVAKGLRRWQDRRPSMSIPVQKDDADVLLAAIDAARKGER
jgi:hypothetical protein